MTMDGRGDSAITRRTCFFKTAGEGQSGHRGLRKPKGTKRRIDAFQNGCQHARSARSLTASGMNEPASPMRRRSGICECSSAARSRRHQSVPAGRLRRAAAPGAMNESKTRSGASKHIVQTAQHQIAPDLLVARKAPAAERTRDPADDERITAAHRAKADLRRAVLLEPTDAPKKSRGRGLITRAPSVESNGSLRSPMRP
jgi:hypothetical protein